MEDVSSAPGSPSAAAPRSLAALTRALRLGRHALFAILLVVAWGRAAGDKTWFEVVAAALGLLYAAHAVSEARALRAPAVVRQALLGLVLLAWLGAVSLTPDFGWLAFPLFFAVLDSWPSSFAVPVVALMAGAVVWGHARVTGWSDVGLATVVGPTVGALVSVGMASALRMLLRENAARQALLDELRAAQADLEATHDALAETRRAAGALEERARLSRDIHDTLAQGFSSIVLLAASGRRAGADPTGALELVEGQARASLDEARAVVADLTPPALQGSGLPAALERLAASASERCGIPVAFDVEGAERELPRAHEVALLRLAQGALANATTHAGAARIALSLSIADDGTRLDVVDNGVGFDPHLTRGGDDGTGYGLRAMRERMAALGGSLTVESAPGEGTAVAAHLPAPGGEP